MYGIGFQELIILLLIGLVCIMPAIVGVGAVIYLVTRKKDPPAT